jgi:hypothetical protein
MRHLTPHRWLPAASAAVLFLVPGLLRAASVIEGVTVDASSWWDQQAGTASWQWIGNLTNNSGLSAPYDVTATHAPHNSAHGMWHAHTWAVDPNPTVTFDLGGTFDLEELYIWNGNQALDLAHIQRGVCDFELYVSTDGGTNYQSLGNYKLSCSTLPAAPITAQRFDLSGQNGVTHVKFRIISTHNSPAGGGDYAGLSEVMFTAVQAPSALELSRFEVDADSVTLAFPSQAGQLFDIYRSTNLTEGFGMPLVAGLPAAGGWLMTESIIEDFSGGLVLGDSRVPFSEILIPGTSYVFIPADGLNAGREVAIVSWTENTVTLAEDIESDISWKGGYRIQTPTELETEWVDTDPPEGRAFYKVTRR